MNTDNVNMSRVQLTAALISDYLTTGFHHSTPEAQQAIAKIIVERLCPTVPKCHEILHELRTSRFTEKEWQEKIPVYFQMHFLQIEQFLNPNDEPSSRDIQIPNRPASVGGKQDRLAASEQRGRH